MFMGLCEHAVPALSMENYALSSFEIAIWGVDPIFGQIQMYLYWMIPRRWNILLIIMSVEMYVSDRLGTL